MGGQADTCYIITKRRHNMVLDIDLFRSDKGHDPEKIRENQRKRYKDVTLVDRVAELDQNWRKYRFQADNWNKVKNSCSKAVGEKKKKKEADGVNDPLPKDITDGLEDVNAEKLAVLSILQIREVL